MEMITPFKFIIASKQEGALWADHIVRITADSSRDADVERLRQEGYTQFFFVQQYGYEFTVADGKIVRGDT
jgi:hypothetical protein